MDVYAFVALSTTVSHFSAYIIALFISVFFFWMAGMALHLNWRASIQPSGFSLMIHFGGLFFTLQKLCWKQSTKIRSVCFWHTILKHHQSYVKILLQISAKYRTSWAFLASYSKCCFLIRLLSESLSPFVSYSSSKFSI